MADTDQFVDDTATAPPSKKGKLLTLLVVAGIVLGEGGLVFFATKLMYKQPASAEAQELTAEAEALAQAQQEVEIPLPELQAFNKREGRLYLCNIEITIRIDADKKEEVEKIIESRKSTILDRFNTVIRSAETKYLNEPGLDTLRRQLRFELDDVLGDDQLILELLIPKFFQSPANV